MKKQRNTFQKREQNNIPETDLNEPQKKYLPYREFKIMVVTMITRTRRIVYEQRNNFKKRQRDRKCKKIPNRNHRAKEHNNCTKNSIEGFISRRDFYLEAWRRNPLSHYSHCWRDSVPCYYSTAPFLGTVSQGSSLSFQRSPSFLGSWSPSFSFKGSNNGLSLCHISNISDHLFCFICLCSFL